MKDKAKLVARISICLPDTIFARGVTAAEKDNRNISNFIANLLDKNTPPLEVTKNPEGSEE